jgi:hypothetical protein
MYVIGINEGGAVVFLTEFNPANKTYRSSKFISAGLEFKTVDDAKKVLSQLPVAGKKIYNGFGRQVFPEPEQTKTPPHYTPDPWAINPPAIMEAPVPPAPAPPKTYGVRKDGRVVSTGLTLEEAENLVGWFVNNVRGPEKIEVVEILEEGK